MGNKKFSNQVNSKLELVRTILHDKYLSTNQKELFEKNKDAKGNDFEMRKKIVPAKDTSYLLYQFNPDKENIFPFFKEVKGIKKICDYILFVEEKSSLFIFLIELKLGKLSPHGQLNASECFVKFIISTAKRLNINLEDDVFIRKIGISEYKSNKQRTKKEALVYDKNYFIDYKSKDFRIVELLI